MKTMWLRILLITSLMLIPAAASAQQPAPSPAPQQDSSAGEHHHPGKSLEGSPQGMDEKMMEHCRAMMEKRQEALQQMEVLDINLEEKIAAMNAASGDKKLEAMAAVINEMAEQRRFMRENFHGMQGCPMCPMMGKAHGMRRHPVLGFPLGDSSRCPMMKHHGTGGGKDIQSQ